MRLLVRLRWLGWLFAFAAPALLAGCRAARTGSSLEPGFYRIQHPAALGLPNEKIFVRDEDSLRLTVPGTDRTFVRAVNRYPHVGLYQKSFDVDVFTIPFKIRPARAGLPPQLNSNFNAAVYLGRRIDFYQLSTQRIAPGLEYRTLRSRGLGYGVFGGIGSSLINGSVTRGVVQTEYDGVIVDTGAAAIYDARIFNIGLAVGFDILLDRNRSQWIYSGKPWFGVLFGLNLN